MKRILGERKTKRNHNLSSSSVPVHSVLFIPLQNEFTAFRTALGSGLSGQ
jgi:hypothetical protein